MLIKDQEPTQSTFPIMGARFTYKKHSVIKYSDVIVCVTTLRVLHFDLLYKHVQVAIAFLSTLFDMWYIYIECARFCVYSPTMKP